MAECYDVVNGINRAANDMAESDWMADAWIRCRAEPAEPSASSSSAGR